jgi:hypothetical protein
MTQHTVLLIAYGWFVMSAINAVLGWGDFFRRVQSKVQWVDLSQGRPYIVFVLLYLGWCLLIGPVGLAEEIAYRVARKDSGENP